MMNPIDDDYEDEDAFDGPSKSQLKRDALHLLDVGDKILKLSADDRKSLELSSELSDAIETAVRIKSNSALKRQRQYIGKLLRSMDTAELENKLHRIQHRKDTNTAQFKRLERWRDELVAGNRDTIQDIIERHPEVDRQHLNQLARSAAREKQQNKAPVAARKLFRYLRELGEESSSGA